MNSFDYSMKIRVPNRLVTEEELKEYLTDQ